MAVPVEVEASIDRAIRMFQDAQARILDEQAEILALPDAERARLTRRSARLVNMAASVQGILDDLRSDMAEWLSTDLPGVYRIGAQAAAGGSSTIPSFVWTQVHVDAVQFAAADMWDDILEATQFVDSDTRRWITEVAQGAVEETLIDGRTFAEVRRDIVRHGAARQLKGDPVPITSVRYKNGVLHSLDTYAEMLIRTKTITAHNQGTITAATAVGITLFEVFDQGCGWSYHDDPIRAHGRIVTAEQARDQPLSHPNCRRSFGGRPDLTAEDAGTLQSSVPVESQTEQAAADRERLATQATRNRNRRARRAARATRATR